MTQLQWVVSSWLRDKGRLPLGWAQGALRANMAAGRFVTRQMAQALVAQGVAEWDGDGIVHRYRCAQCGKWHTGRQP